MSRGQFRGDVQGLRALAVLLVAVDHADVGPFHGGYVGVDVFFVISGFLITGLLLKDHDRHGRISLRDFYARRARRILPASLLVLLVTVGASVALLSGVQAIAAIEDAAWVLFFAGNIKFARDGTDYFQGDASPSPFQHYWSLAVEEQFYLFWPLLIAVVIWVVARRRRNGGHVAPRGNARYVALALLVVIAASFAFSLLDTASEPVGAYFSTRARVWELATGALAACLVARAQATPRGLRTAASWIGLLAILTAALTYDATTPFPGSAAALPVLGAVLLLLGGVPTAGASALPQRLLALRPFRAVGDWSYSFYLWHWPFLVFAAAIWGPVSGARGLAVLVAALAVSALTYHLVENPVRHARVISVRPSRGLLLYPAALVLVIPALVGAKAVVMRVDVPHGEPITLAHYGQRSGEPVPSFDPSPYVALVQASLLAADNGLEIPGGLRPDPFHLDKLKPDLGACDYWNDPSTDLCPMGDPDGDKTMVLVGDSHARQWIPALDRIAEKHGYRAYWLVRVGCPGADVTPWLKVGGPAEECADFQDWARSEVDDLAPDLTLVASEANPNRGYVLDDGSHVTDTAGELAAFEEGVRRTLVDVSAHSERVVYLDDPPATTAQAVECLAKRRATLERCVSSQDPLVDQFIDAASRGAASAGVQVLDPTRWFCLHGRCPGVVGDYITRRDLAHVTVEYASYLTPALDKALGMSRDRSAVASP
ncbi:acyltransferase family protein [Nocardioides mangrovi]|uniref:Acyltransferase n=1 Tax=Nocardioides mangrovi TaxID=2874580 RepID=A0ABS7UJF0_9ACTN|nr:acyltransferase family protein [Nocardioides mangrovi]MBZ5741007.1 acyltransferase [Nocardioides mangrovi]